MLGKMHSSPPVEMVLQSRISSSFSTKVTRNHEGTVATFTPRCVLEHISMFWLDLVRVGYWRLGGMARIDVC